MKTKIIVFAVERRDESEMIRITLHFLGSASLISNDGTTAGADAMTKPCFFWQRRARPLDKTRHGREKIAAGFNDQDSEIRNPQLHAQSRSKSCRSFAREENSVVASASSRCLEFIGKMPMLLRCERGEDFFEARIAAEQIPSALANETAASMYDYTDMFSH